MISINAKSYSIQIGKFRITKTLTIDEAAKIKKSELARNIYVNGMIPVRYFPSVNSMYNVNKYGGKFLRPELGELRCELQSELDNSPAFRDIIIPNEPLSLTLGFFLNYDIGKRDYDNMIKFIQDTLAEYFKFNDHCIYDGRQFKRLVYNSDTEWLFFRIEKNRVSNFSIDKNELLSMELI